MEKPKFYNHYCDPECPYLETPIDSDGNFDYTKSFVCNKYNVILDYYDWVIQYEKCAKDFYNDDY